jgi:hypothetical protein
LRLLGVVYSPFLLEIKFKLLLVESLFHAGCNLILDHLFVCESRESLTFPDALLVLEVLLYLFFVIHPNVRILFVILQLSNVSCFLQLETYWEILFHRWAANRIYSVPLHLLRIKLCSF